MEKICSKCKKTKLLSYFYKRKGAKFGIDTICKNCRKILNREWRENNKEYIQNYYENNKEYTLNYHKKYYENNKEHKLNYQKNYRENNKKHLRNKRKEYCENNPEEIRDYNRKRYQKDKQDSNKVLSNLISSGIRRSLKGNKNGGHWEGLVGYVLKDLIKHLKSILPPNIAWNDYINGKTGLHIDHKIPISAFNFRTAKDIDFQKCWALTNLQLLPTKENLEKGTTLEQPFQPSFAI